MNACEFSSYLSDYLDRQLNLRQKSMLEDHLPLCNYCRTQLEEYMQLKRVCTNLPVEEMPAGLHQRIMVQVKRQNKFTGSTSWIQRVAVPLAAVIILFIIGKAGYFIIGNTSRDTRSTLERENMIMAIPESNSPSSAVHDEMPANNTEMENSDKLADDITEDSIKNSEVEVSSNEEGFSTGQIFNMPRSVRLGIGAALLLVCTFFIIKVIKLKR